jgi:hypothetical protein
MKAKIILLMYKTALRMGEIILLIPKAILRMAKMILEMRETILLMEEIILTIPKAIFPMAKIILAACKIILQEILNKRMIYENRI